MTELRDVIHTERTVGVGDSPDDPVHEHEQHFTPDGDLIVEWCPLELDCEYIKEGE